MSELYKGPLCPICGNRSTRRHRHCFKCLNFLCGDEICEGNHVHEDGYCFRCGDVLESQCEADFEVEREREPRLVEV